MVAKQLKNRTRGRIYILLAIITLCVLGFILALIDAPTRLKDFTTFHSGKTSVHSAYSSEEKKINHQLATILGNKSQYIPADCEHGPGSETRDLGYCSEGTQYDTKMNINATDADIKISELDNFFLSLGWKTTDTHRKNWDMDDKGTIYYLGYTKKYPNEVTCWVNGDFGAGSPDAFTTYSCYKSLDLGPH